MTLMTMNGKPLHPSLTPLHNPLWVRYQGFRRHRVLLRVSEYPFPPVIPFWLALSTLLFNCMKIEDREVSENEEGEVHVTEEWRSQQGECRWPGYTQTPLYWWTPGPHKVASPIHTPQSAKVRGEEEGWEGSEVTYQMDMSSVQSVSYFFLSHHLPMNWKVICLRRFKEAMEKYANERLAHVCQEGEIPGSLSMWIGFTTM